MTRLRKADGSVEELGPEVAAIEICSTDGRLARVFILGRDGRVTSLVPDDQEFKDYVEVMKAQVAQLIPYGDR